MTYIRITTWILRSAAEWAASTQVMHAYEAGVESDTGKVKRGNGLDVYSALSYLPGFGGGGGGDMLSTNNLSDVANAVTARANIMPSYTGNSLKFMRVNAGETDLEYVTLAGGGDMLAANNLSDVASASAARNNILPLKTGNALELLRVNAGETDYELFAFSESDPIFSAWYSAPGLTFGVGGIPLAPIGGAYVSFVEPSNSKAVSFDTSGLTSDKLIVIPDANGTMALLSDFVGYVPYTGASSDLDLGAQKLSAATIGIGTAAGAELLHLDGGASTARIKLDADNNVARIFSFRTDDTQRWAFRVDGNETGANVGADFQVRRYDDGGAFIDAPITIVRSTGRIAFNGFNFDISGSVSFLSGSHTGSSSGTNTGDQTSIVGISGTKAQFDTACSDGNFVYSGDVITVLTGTKAQFDTTCSDGNFLYVGDVTQYTDELAQDAVGAMVTDGSLVYVDATPLLTRGALTGAVTASQGSNTTALGSFTRAQLDTAVSDGNVLYVGDITQYTDELAQDAIGAMIANSTFVSLAYVDGAPSLTASLSATGTPSASNFLRGDNTWASPTAAVADGDYGDVAVSGTGTVFTVESVLKSFVWKGVQTDTTSTSGSLNDYALSADVTELRFNCPGQILTLKGLVGGVDGRIVRIVQEDTTAGSIVITNEQAASTAANRIHCNTSIVLLSQCTSCTLKYDGSISRWTVMNVNMDYTSSGFDLTGTMVNPTIKALAITNAKVNDVAESKITFTDITTGNFSTAAHGFVPKGTNVGAVLRDDGTWGGPLSTAGVGTSPTASQTDTINHGLGRTPTTIIIFGIGTFTSSNSATPTPHSHGSWNSTGNRCVYMTSAGTTTQGPLTSTTFAIFLATSSGNNISGVIGTVGSTSFAITWTETGTATAQAYHWIAF